jgi:hypothetical protein
MNQLGSLDFFIGFFRDYKSVGGRWFYNEPFLKLIDACIIHRKIHPITMEGGRKTKPAFPFFGTGTMQYDSILGCCRSKPKIRMPAIGQNPLCLPETIHKRGSGKISIAMPAFNHAIVFHVFCRSK